MGAQHTPGPWHVHVEQEYNIGRTKSVYICAGVGWPAGQLARVNAADGLYERDANARLIAEAPAMLEALFQYRDDLRYPPTGDSRLRRLERVNAILARIDGESGQ